MSESNRVEYKRELTASLEKEVVAFLNYHEGGIIYLGIDESGDVIGIHDCDSVQLKIKDRLKHNILPSCMGLFDIIREEKDGKIIICLTVASGSEKPYYLKKQGMSGKGCYIRVGSASEPMPVRMIETLLSGRVRNSVGSMRSPRNDLTFEQLKIYYQEADLTLNENFKNNLELLTPEDQLNYAAYLMADENGVSIKVAKYADTTRVDLIENSEYGYCSLIKAVNRVLEKLEVENRTFSKITSTKRLERRMVDSKALREAVINAIIHNDYSIGAPPKFELFSDRLEITSTGGLPMGVNKEDFYSGLSIPRNKELMRIFRDLELVEHLGSGIPRILQKYDRSIFTISDNFLRVTFHYKEGFDKRPEKVPVETRVKTPVETRVKTPEMILELLSDNQNMSLVEVAESIGKSLSAVERAVSKLVKGGRLKHIGPAKGGYWDVLDR